MIPKVMHLGWQESDSGINDWKLVKSYDIHDMWFSAYGYWILHPFYKNNNLRQIFNGRLISSGDHKVKSLTIKL